MNFFYHSTAGAIDLVALIAICGLAMGIGSYRSRMMASAMLAVFLIDRILLWAVAEIAQMMLGSLAEFMAMLAMLGLVKGRVGRAMAILFACKIGLYTSVLMGGMGFETMTAAVTVVCFLQLILIMIGVPRSGLHRWIGRGVLARPSAGSSADIVENGMQRR
jgi:hypothetical protein